MVGWKSHLGEVNKVIEPKLDVPAPKEDKSQLVRAKVEMVAQKKEKDKLVIPEPPKKDKPKLVTPDVSWADQFRSR